MKDFIKLLLMTCFLLVGTSAFANSYCPSKNEFMQRLQSYPAPELSYYEPVFNSCIDYFRTTQNPDCERLIILTSTIFMVEDQAAGKAKINEVVNRVSGQCKMYADVVRQMVN